MKPVVGIGWGAFVFGEELRGGGWIAAQLAGCAAITGCTVLLARSPPLQGPAGAHEDADGTADDTDSEDTVEDSDDAEDSGTPVASAGCNCRRNQENH